jgi:uncharacterized protein (DUF1499 family)
MKKRHLCIPLLTIILAGCTSAPEQPGADAVLPPCGMLPNCVNSDSGTGGSAIAPLQATTEQWQALKRWLAAQDNWTITEDSPDFLQAVVKTPLMQFRDDVQLVFNRQADDIQVRSSSRLGISDMGANRRRIESLRAHLASEAAAAAD